MITQTKKPTVVVHQPGKQPRVQPGMDRLIFQLRRKDEDGQYSDIIGSLRFDIPRELQPAVIVQTVERALRGL